MSVAYEAALAAALRVIAASSRPPVGAYRMTAIMPARVAVDRMRRAREQT